MCQEIHRRGRPAQHLIEIFNFIVPCPDEQYRNIHKSTALSQERVEGRRCIFKKKKKKVRRHFSAAWAVEWLCNLKTGNGNKTLSGGVSFSYGDMLCKFHTSSFVNNMATAAHGGCLLVPAFFLHHDEFVHLKNDFFSFALQSAVACVPV